MHHPRTVLALVLAGTLLLGAGCSDDPAEADPEPILPSSSSASPTDEPSPSASPSAAPTMPAAAKERSYDGAIAFVEHWVDVFNHAQNTGDTRDLARVSDPDCVSCEGAISSIEALYEAGGSLRGGRWRLKEVATDPVAPLTQPILSSPVRQATETVREQASGDPNVARPITFDALFQLTREGGGWVLRELEIKER